MSPHDVDWYPRAEGPAVTDAWGPLPIVAYPGTHDHDMVEGWWQADGGNWGYQVRWEQLTPGITARLRSLVTRAGR